MARSLTRAGKFYSAAGTDQKTAQSWRVSVALSAYAHEPAQQQTRRKNQNKDQTLERTTYAD
jgi:hypothetical protein